MHTRKEVAIVSILCFSSFALSFALPMSKYEKQRGCAEMPVMPPSNNTDIGQRIINGINGTSAGHIPYQLQLKYKTVLICGAVLISSRYALSAAHCFDKAMPIKQYQIVAGAFYNYNFVGTKNKTVQMRYIKKVTQLNHPEGEQRTGNNPDIAIIEFDAPFEFTPFVKPACLPSKPALMGAKCITSGWGKTIDSEDAPIQILPLQVAELEILDGYQCNKVYHDGFYDHELCVQTPFKGPCNGDSGGPLVCATDGGATIHGIVSRGSIMGCGQPEWPGIYVDVYQFIDQIEFYLEKNFDNPCPTDVVSYKDGSCDMDLNEPENCFDGGDCCLEYVESDCNWKCEMLDFNCAKKCLCFAYQNIKFSPSMPMIEKDFIKNKLV